MVAGRSTGVVLVVTDEGDGYEDTLVGALAGFGHRASASRTADLGTMGGVLDIDVVVLISASTRAPTVRACCDLLVEADVPFLCVVANDRLELRLAAFEAGADDVIGRPVSPAELDARLQVVLRRTRPVLDVLAAGPVVVDPRAHLATWDGAPLELTPLEFAILAALLRNRGQVLSKRQLLTELWGVDGHDVNLVEVHVSALRRKLESHGPRLIHTVRGAGYVVRRDVPDPPAMLAVV